jgi:uncharacterized membrane protein YgcG
LKKKRFVLLYELSGKIFGRLNERKSIFYKLKCFLAGFAFMRNGANRAFAGNKTVFDKRIALPAPTGFVNDYVGVIDAATKQKLEAQLKSLKETTNPPIEIAVAIVKTTGERPIFDYSLAVARGWKIGAKELDNPGALLLIAIDDRKYFTQVSKDLEDELPDGLVGQLQRQNLVPAFRQGDYSKGVSDTIDAYLKTIETRSSVRRSRPRNRIRKQKRKSRRCFHWQL